MKHLTILVDMDDTIENLAATWIRYLNQRHGTDVDPDTITEWELWKAFPDLSQEEVYKPLFEEEMWELVEPLEGAAEALQELIMDGHKVFIVTASAYKSLQPKMERVLFRYFPFLRWRDVIVTNNKQMLNGDVMIDDAPHNLIGGKYEKLLMDAVHNRGFDAERHRMTRVHNWEDAYSIICEIAQERGM